MARRCVQSCTFTHMIGQPDQPISKVGANMFRSQLSLVLQVSLQSYDVDEVHSSASFHSFAFQQYGDQQRPSSQGNAKKLHHIF